MQELQQSSVVFHTELSHSGFANYVVLSTLLAGLCERRWAITLLDRVLYLLEDEFRRKGKHQFFTMCRGTLTGLGMEEQYAAIAAACGMTAPAVKVAVHRMRARYRELLLAEIAQTVSSESEVEGELRALMNAVQG